MFSCIWQQGLASHHQHRALMGGVTAGKHMCFYEAQCTQHGWIDVTHVTVVGLQGDQACIVVQVIHLQPQKQAHLHAKLGIYNMPRNAMAYCIWPHGLH